MKDVGILEDLLILSCEEDYEICVPFLEKGKESSHSIVAIGTCLLII